ncbi:hypothetical protein J6590_034114 [Homalodisca vitripennis]|nr:hypothetical protein J6590_034114 [Homalodisca vitripennis]
MSVHNGQRKKSYVEEPLPHVWPTIRVEIESRPHQLSVERIYLGLLSAGLTTILCPSKERNCEVRKPLTSGRQLELKLNHGPPIKCRENLSRPFVSWIDDHTVSCKSVYNTYSTFSLKKGIVR